MNAAKPFECVYPPQFAELLYNLNTSLAISTYQAGKIVLLSPHDKDHLIQLPRTFENAMGMATSDDKIAIATQSKVVLLQNSEDLARKYINKPNTYDSIYMPRVSYYSGYLALHDMAFINNEIIAVNTLFSALCNINEKESFTPIWQPPFITDLQPEDRCHLNGMAIENNEIKYLTALGKSDTANGWRENKMNGGILMEYPSGKIILDNLSMPHSPRIYDGKLYLLNSAQGELIEVDVENKTYSVVVNVGGFARGMTKIGDYLFIGVSKLRHNSAVFRDLPIAQTSFAGVVAVHLPYKVVVGQIEYKMSVEEIYDVKVLPNKKRPNIISTEMEENRAAITFSSQSFWGKLKSEEEAEKEEKAKQKKAVNIQLIKTISPSALYDQFHTLIIDDYKNALKNKLENNNQTLFVASENQNPIGMLVFDITEPNSIKINSIFIKPEYRGKGLGTALIKTLENLIKQNKINYCEVELSKDLFEDVSVFNFFRKFSFLNVVEAD